MCIRDSPKLLRPAPLASYAPPVLPYSTPLVLPDHPPSTVTAPSWYYPSTPASTVTALPTRTAIAPSQ
eukprot:2609176-Rhodomonas_salina.2